MSAPLNDSVRIKLLTVLGLFAAVVPTGVGGLSGMPHAEEYRESIALVRDVLALHRTRSEMIVLVGDIPTRCVEVPGEAEICVWSLGKQEPVWRPLAKALSTADRLNLICEFPANGALRSEDSCSVHPKRTNRSYYMARIRGRGPGPAQRRKSVTSVSRAELKAQAQQLLADAHTAIELSTLVGDAPAACQSRDAGFLCLWKANSGTYGHGTLAVSIDASFSKKIRLSCRLPAEGTRRAPDACSVNIGG